MRKTRFAVPVLTPEISFSVKHWQQMDAVCEDKTGVIEKRFGKELAELVEKIYDRVGKDIKDRIISITKSIDDCLRGMARIDWSQRNIESNWGTNGSLYGARGRKKLIAYLGAYLTGWKGRPHLVLVVWPRGGDSGQKQLLIECEKNRKCSLVSMKEKPEDWPGWEEEPAIVFHRQAITDGTSLDKLRLNASLAASKFLSSAMLILRGLTDTPN